MRTRIECIEQQAIEEFNGYMETVFELLEYKNLEQIWLERTQREVREGRRKVTKSSFELHIIRQTESEPTFEDTLDNLSKSEREVTGLISALVGYLAHDLYETIPFMLLDSLEAINSTRMVTLVEYLQEYNKYLIVALCLRMRARCQTSNNKVQKSDSASPFACYRLKRISLFAVSLLSVLIITQ